jgi:methionine-rich copper-binding protein CopC
MGRQILATFVLVFAIVPQAMAHAVLLTAVPAANQSIAGPDIDVKLHFNCRIDSARSRLALSLPDRRIRNLSLLQPEPGMLEARVTGLSTGDYHLQWQVLAADGHITRGEVPFSVK